MNVDAIMYTRGPMLLSINPWTQSAMQGTPLFVYQHMKACIYQLLLDGGFLSFIRRGCRILVLRGSSCWTVDRRVDPDDVVRIKQHALLTQFVAQTEGIVPCEAVDTIMLTLMACAGV